MNKRFLSVTIICCLILFLVVANNILSQEQDKNFNHFKNFIEVTFDNNGQKTPSLSLAIAKTMEEQAKGLMFVKSMPKNKGMIFIYNDESEHFFWMKNTFIPLDMIFLNRDKIVVGIIPNTKILSEKSLSIDQPSQYIIELNAGEAEKLGITVGSKLIM